MQFHENVSGFQRGERVTVKGQDETARILVERGTGEAALLTLDQFVRLQAYESNKIALAPRDVIRITQSVFAKDKQRRFEAGQRNLPKTGTSNWSTVG